MLDRLPNLRHLQLAREAARLGSLSAAARASHVSQPAATQGLRRLERELGAGLFERSGSGVRPTAAGVLCLARIDRVLRQIEEALADVAGLREQRGGGALRRLSTAQLEAMVAIVDRGGVAEAARFLGQARATTHRAARDLERVLDLELFERTSHGVRATRDAVRFARCVGIAAAEFAQARAEVAALAGVECGESVVGAMPLARSTLVPQALLRFVPRHPGHRISVLDGPYDGMLEALRSGRADVLIGALRDRVPDGVQQEFLFDDTLAIIVRARHPLVAETKGGRRMPSASQLASYAWIAPRRESPLRAHFDRLLPRTARRQRAPIECNAFDAAYALLRSSDLVMLSSVRQVRHEITQGELVALPHPQGRVVRSIGLTTRRDWLPTEAQRELLGAIRAASVDGDQQA